MTKRAPHLLAIETAGSACSAAIARGEKLLACETRAMRHGHGEALLPMIDRVMAAAGLAPAALDAIAVAVGPGGFTGIRVGLAAAHGIALATQARLIGVSSFAAVAAAVSGGAGNALLVALDSRRDDLYVQLFAPDRVSPLAQPAAVLGDRLQDYVAGQAADGRLLLAGDATAAAEAALGKAVECIVIENSAPDARAVASAALRQLRGTPDGPVRPLYLRPPDVTLPRPPVVAVRPTISAIPPSAAVPLAAMHRVCFPEEPWDQAALERVLALSGGFGYIAWQGDDPIGFVLARDLGDEIEILSLGVLPRSRRRGAGRSLIDQVIVEAGRRDIGSVVLEVAAENTAARRLYAASGFVQVGRRPHYYRSAAGRADALILRRQGSNFADR